MTASEPRLLLAGGTGLVGGDVLRERLADRGWKGKVFAPLRRTPSLTDRRLIPIVGPLTETQADERVTGELRERLGEDRLDAYISCLGTTLDVAGSREAFIAVDRELVLRLARLAFQLGARRAILVSSVGASRQSGNFYLRIKGEVEDAMGEAGFQRLDILQPGLLLGARGEVRRGESIAQKLAPIYNPLLRGAKLRRYRAIPALTVARAIVRLSEQTQPGQFVHQHDAIVAIADAP
ncbi:MAG: NAD-dependent dehydratase [Arenimonas sp.]